MGYLIVIGGIVLFSVIFHWKLVLSNRVISDRYWRNVEYGWLLITILSLIVAVKEIGLSIKSQEYAIKEREVKDIYDKIVTPVRYEYESFKTGSESKQDSDYVKWYGKLYEELKYGYGNPDLRIFCGQNEYLTVEPSPKSDIHRSEVPQFSTVGYKRLDLSLPAPMLEQPRRYIEDLNVMYDEMSKLEQISSNMKREPIDWYLRIFTTVLLSIWISLKITKVTYDYKDKVSKNSYVSLLNDYQVVSGDDND